MSKKLIITVIFLICTTIICCLSLVKDKADLPAGNEEEPSTAIEASDVKPLEFSELEVLQDAEQVDAKYDLANSGSAYSMDIDDCFLFVKDTRDGGYFEYYAELHFLRPDEEGNWSPYPIMALSLYDFVTHENITGTVFKERMPNGVSVLRIGVLKDNSRPLGSEYLVKGKLDLVIDFERYLEKPRYSATIQIPESIPGKVLKINVYLDEYSMPGGAQQRNAITAKFKNPDLCKYLSQNSELRPCLYGNGNLTVQYLDNQGDCTYESNARSLNTYDFMIIKPKDPTHSIVAVLKKEDAKSDLTWTMENMVYSLDPELIQDVSVDLEQVISESGIAADLFWTGGLCIYPKDANYDIPLPLALVERVGSYKSKMKITFSLADGHYEFRFLDFNKIKSEKDVTRENMDKLFDFQVTNGSIDY